MTEKKNIGSILYLKSDENLSGFDVLRGSPQTWIIRKIQFLYLTYTQPWTEPYKWVLTSINAKVVNTYASYLYFSIRFHNHHKNQAKYFLFKPRVSWAFYFPSP